MLVVSLTFLLALIASSCPADGKQHWKVWTHADILSCYCSYYKLHTHSRTVCTQPIYIQSTVIVNMRSIWPTLQMPQEPAVRTLLQILRTGHSRRVRGWRIAFGWLRENWSTYWGPIQSQGEQKNFKFVKWAGGHCDISGFWENVFS